MPHSSPCLDVMRNFKAQKAQGVRFLGRSKGGDPEVTYTALQSQAMAALSPNSRRLGVSMLSLSSVSQELPGEIIMTTVTGRDNTRDNT